MLARYLLGEFGETKRFYFKQCCIERVTVHMYGVCGCGNFEHATVAYTGVYIHTVRIALVYGVCDVTLLLGPLCVSDDDGDRRRDESCHQVHH